jgi:DNA gyrase subunit A
VATSAGNVLRMPLASFLTASTKAGRRFVRLGEKDIVVMASVPEAGDESVLLVSDDGHVIHFPIEQVAELAGVGKGVRGIKLAGKSRCLGGRVVSSGRDVVSVENTNGNMVDVRASKYTVTSRGGKGYEVIRRGGFRKIVPDEPPIVDWNNVPEIGNPKN